MSTIDHLIERSWDVHDNAPDTEPTQRLRAAIWALEDALDEQTRVQADPQLSELPDDLRDRVVDVIVARVDVQAVTA